MVEQQQKLCALHRKEKVCIDEHHLSKHISPHQNYQKSVENLCWINYIRNLEPNCQYSCSSCSSSSQDCSQIFASPSKSLKASQNICLYTKHRGRGVAIVVVVCGEMCGKIDFFLIP